jgi:hypothetical protein
MNRSAILLTTVVASLAALVFLPGTRGEAALEPKVQKALLRIAAALEKGDPKGVRKEAAALARQTREELEEVMAAFRHRRKGGLGIGAKPADPIDVYSIEATFQRIDRNGLTDRELASGGMRLARIAWLTAGVAEVVLVWPEVNDWPRNGQGRENWVRWSRGMGEAARELARAARAKDRQAVRTAVRKLNENCNACHFVERP